MKHVEGLACRECGKSCPVAPQHIWERLLDDSGALRRFVNLYVNDEDVRFLDGLETELPDGRKCRSFRRSPAAEWSVP